MNFSMVWSASQSLAGTREQIHKIIQDLWERVSLLFGGCHAVCMHVTGCAMRQCTLATTKLCTKHLQRPGCTSLIVQWTIYPTLVLHWTVSCDILLWDIQLQQRHWVRIEDMPAPMVLYHVCGFTVSGSCTRATLGPASLNMIALLLQDMHTYTIHTPTHRLHTLQLIWDTTQLVNTLGNDNTRKWHHKCTYWLVIQYYMYIPHC